MLPRAQELVKPYRVVAYSKALTAARGGEYAECAQLRTATLFRPPPVLVVSPPCVTAAALVTTEQHHKFPRNFSF